jgi:phosphate transport system permease protein
MSDAYATDTDAQLVDAESNVYDRGLDGAIALSVVGFALALLAVVELLPLDATGSTLTAGLGTVLAVVVGAVGTVGLASYTNVVPVTSQRVRGIALGLVVTTLGLTLLGVVLPVSLATLLGLVLLIEAVAVAAAGVVSRFGNVGTSPSSSAGLFAGVAFGVIGVVFGSVLGGWLVGFGSPLWAVAGLGVGAVLLVGTVVPREDLGSTLPAAVVVGATGLLIAGNVIGVGWQWNPSNLSGGFTGNAVVPILVLFGSIFSAWAAAKCRAGFGAVGREYGAFLVINLNALLMVAVMVAIVVFVTMKGVGYAFHGFSIGAVSALVLLSPVLLVAVATARHPAGSAEWHSGARLLFRVLPLAVVGGVAAVVASVIATGSALRYEFTYDVLVNRQLDPLDTSIAVTPEATVGALVLVAPMLLLAVYFFRRYGNLQSVGTPVALAERVRGLLPPAVTGVVALTALFVILGPAPFGLPVGSTLGLAVVFAGSVGATALALAPLAGILTGDGEGGLPQTATDRAPLFTLGVFGGLALLTAVLFLEPAAAVTAGTGLTDPVPMVAVVGAVASAATAVLTGIARRDAEASITRRLLTEETRLALVGTAGFLTLLGLHVAATGQQFELLALTVANEGTFSWPMAQEAYIPLGAEPGGIMPAVVGTVWLVVGATTFALPLGVGAAIFLTEYAEQGRFTALVEIATNALWSTPSIVFGLFGAAFLIPRLGGDESMLAGMLVLGFMLLPLVLITSREAIKAVPDEYRDASAALGVNQWTTIRSVVLPAAMPGVITGVILGVGRIAGETAPLILVLGSTLNSTEAIDVIGGFEFVAQPPFIANDALLSASASLPTQVWAVIAAGVSGSPSMGWATAFILLMVVLTFYAVGITARTYFRRKLNYE